MRKQMAEPGRLTGQGLATHRELKDIGEPLKWGINDPMPLLHGAGFRHVLALPFDALCLALEGSYDRAREYRFQLIAQASRATELF